MAMAMKGKMNLTSIYNDLENVAKATKSQKISSEEIYNKYLKFVEEGLKEEVIAKLDKNGYITRTSRCDSNLLRDAKRDFDLNFLSSLSTNGKYVYEPTNKDDLEKIVHDPDNTENTKLYVESDTKVNGKFEIYHPTINNSNESSRRKVAKAKKIMENATPIK